MSKKRGRKGEIQKKLLEDHKYIKKCHIKLDDGNEKDFLNCIKEFKWENKSSVSQHKF